MTAPENERPFRVLRGTLFRKGRSLFKVQHDMEIDFTEYGKGPTSARRLCYEANDRSLEEGFQTVYSGTLRVDPSPDVDGWRIPTQIESETLQSLLRIRQPTRPQNQWILSEEPPLGGSSKHSLVDNLHEPLWVDIAQSLKWSESNSGDYALESDQFETTLILKQGRVTEISSEYLYQILHLWDYHSLTYRNNRIEGPDGVVTALPFPPFLGEVPEKSKQDLFSKYVMEGKAICRQGSRSVIF